MPVQLNNVSGIVCGRRNDGSRCVLWDDETLGDEGFEWFKAEEFSAKFNV